MLILKKLLLEAIYENLTFSEAWFKNCRLFEASVPEVSDFRLPFRAAIFSVLVSIVSNFQAS